MGYATLLCLRYLRILTIIVRIVFSEKFVEVNTLKRYVPFRGSSNATRTRTIAGLSFGLLALLACSLFLYSLTIKHQGAHASPAPMTSVSKTWYLAEGRVGGGFREYITIEDPDPSVDCNATITYMPEGDITNMQAKRHMVARKPLAVKTIVVPHASRYTASVNQDMGVTETQQPGTMVSAMVTVPASSSCAGVVVERPMYFNYNGVVSGSDVLGTTTLAQSFYLADVSTQAGTNSFMTSYMTVLNPSSVVPATVTVTYYANGVAVSTQTAYVAPGARGTIYPGVLPSAHVAATITANTPVAVERSTYMSNMVEGNAGTVSSSASIEAAQTLSDHWLFAEGYTGGQYQENLVLSNLSDATTTATITLEYQSIRGQPGHNQVVTVPVPAFSQVIENINALNTTPTGTCDVPCATAITSEVSADVTAPTASLVVERQMFFHYTHTLPPPNTNINVTTTGGSDVMGALSEATHVANFAEGYTNAGYNTWITLQNPMATSETLAVTIVNEYGRSYTDNITVTAKSRYTVDITALTRQNLVHAGDDVRGYQVSTSVQATTAGNTFVAERPMYFNTSENNQGGSDVVGFTGITSTLPAGAITNFPVLSANSGPDGIAADAKGNLWFTELNTNKIGVITSGGITTEYAIPTANSLPTGITKGPDGNMWFLEKSANRIASITPSGTVTEYNNTGLSANAGLEEIVTGPDGNLWFTESIAHKVGEFVLNGTGSTPAGTITEYSTGITPGSVPFGITAGPAGSNTVWFTESNTARVGSVATAASGSVAVGAITEHGTLSVTANGIALGADGNLWYTEVGTGKVGNIVPSGTFTPTDFAIPSASSSTTTLYITAGPGNTLWFTEEGTGKIGQITTGTTPAVTDFPVPGIGANTTDFITVGADGNVWFTETSLNQVGRVVVG